jgi:hypothetical protein
MLKLFFLLTHSLIPNVEALIIKEHGFPMNAHLLWKYIKEKFSETTVVQDSRDADCLTKLVRPVEQTGQTDMAKSAGTKLQRRKRHQSNQNSTSQTTSLPSVSHGECLMAKGKKRRSQRRLRAKMKKKTKKMILIWTT